MIGAAQGDFAGGEIVEQGACALYLCEVGCPATLLRLIWRQSKSFSSCAAITSDGIAPGWKRCTRPSSTIDRFDA